jgi:hypothetical protein
MFVGWENFYGMVGQTAGTLIGLMFVVVTLGATLGGEVRRKALLTAVPMLVTPTLVHFGAVLFIAMLALVPKASSVVVPWCLLACGVAGIVYVVILGAGIFSDRPSLMDRADIGAHAAYVPVPAIAYITFAISAVVTLLGLRNANLAVGGGIVILVVVGIRNAWGMALFVARSGQNDVDNR